MRLAHVAAPDDANSSIRHLVHPGLQGLETEIHNNYSTPGGAAQKARQFGFARSTADWRELVADPKVEAVMIASPQHTHMEVALAAFAAGRHVFYESRWAWASRRVA